MKITRQKHAKKHLGFFRNNFGAREPYQILLDGTFCQAALRGRIQLREQLPRYLMGEIQLCTTRWAPGRAAGTRPRGGGRHGWLRGGWEGPHCGQKGPRPGVARPRQPGEEDHVRCRLGPPPASCHLGQVNLPEPWACRLSE